MFDLTPHLTAGDWMFIIVAGLGLLISIVGAWRESR